MFTLPAASSYGMSIGILIQPTACWKPDLLTFAKLSTKLAQKPERVRDWPDFACDGQWSEAIIGYMKANWRGQHLMWRVINAVAAESRPETRSLTRSVTQEVLTAMMDLIRARRVMRYRRRWVAALELPPELRPSSK